MSGFLTAGVGVHHFMFLPQLQNRLRVQRQCFWSYGTAGAARVSSPKHRDVSDQVQRSNPMQLDHLSH
jgi:hypothetical protein